jgi:hypothetical protein
VNSKVVGLAPGHTDSHGSAEKLAKFVAAKVLTEFRQLGSENCKPEHTNVAAGKIGAIQISDRQNVDI